MTDPHFAFGVANFIGENPLQQTKNRCSRRSSDRVGNRVPVSLRWHYPDQVFRSVAIYPLSLALQAPDKPMNLYMHRNISTPIKQGYQDFVMDQRLLRLNKTGTLRVDRLHVSRQGYSTKMSGSGTSTNVLTPPRAHDSCDKVLHCEVRTMPRPRGKLQGCLRVGSAHRD